MEMKAICPCPKLSCPNHGHCDNCTSRHVRLGYLNYCGFHTILPTLQQVIAESPESPSAKKLDGLLTAQLKAYDKLMAENNLDQAHQTALLKKVANYSDH